MVTAPTLRELLAARDNAIDVRGVAPAASLYCVKVLNAPGQGSWSGVIDGLDWLWNEGQPRVHVVNMSLGGPGRTRIHLQAGCRAAARGRV